MRVRYSAACLALILLACLDDPLGPGLMTVSLARANADSVWSGAPAEALPAIRIKIKDAEGHAIAGATVLWETFGKQARLSNATAQSNAAGEASAVWLLGTDAAEEQRLQVTVQAARQEAQLVLRARAVPNVVSGLRVTGDTAPVLRVGDTLSVQVAAIDPYGNVFPAPDVTASLSDTTLGSTAGAHVIGGPRRGRGLIRINSHGVGTTLPLHVTQFVAAIVATRETLVFSSLGAQLPVSYAVLDDRGREVHDTIAAMAVTDTSIVQLDGAQLRAVAPGQTALQVELAPASASIPLTVDQRIALLRLSRDTIRFDALFDTTTLHPIAHDSLGSDVRQPAVVFEIQNDHVAEFSDPALLKAVTPGVTFLTVRDPETGISASVPVVVHQVVRSIEVSPVTFDALGDTVTALVTPRDRLGSPVADAVLTYSVSDSAVANVGAGGRLRSATPGQTSLTIQDAETGIATTTDVTVQQRIATLSLNADTLAFHALQDTARFSVVGIDRLGTLVADAPARTNYVSTDPAVVAVDTRGVAQSAGNGSALVVAQSTDGPADTVRVQVRQVARTLTASLNYDKPIITLPVGTALPVVCQAYDANGFPVEETPVLSGTRASTVSGTVCGDVRVARSGFDTLVFSSGAVEATVPVIVAVAPALSTPTGEVVVADSLPAPAGPWAPSVIQDPHGGFEVLYTAFSALPDSSNSTRGDLHRLVWQGGNQFTYGGVVLRHDDNICSPQGQGLENAVVLPRADGAGWRMFYAAGSNQCYGWQVFSATSADGLTWTKEPGVRLSNSGVDSISQPPWPVGEGMVVDQLPSGEWRMITSSFEHLTPPDTNKWQITEWRSPDQLTWTYVGTVLTTRDMPAGWQGSVYSPTVREIAAGVWRMLFTADGRGTPGSRSAIWSAVTTDRVHWQVERELVGALGENIYYAALLGDRVLFVRSPAPGNLQLATAQISMP